MGTIRILLAEDHTLVREGTKGILERESDLEVIAEAADGQQALQLARRLKPDIALVDIAMPQMDGIQLTKAIKEECPQIAVIILSAYDDDEYVYALLEAGAEGYLLKTTKPRELVDAIRAVHQGESVLHPAIARKVVQHYVSPARGRQEIERLTERELEVLRLAAKGLTNSQIAEALVISVRTAQGHISSILGKLGVSSRTEAVMEGLRLKLYTLDELFEDQ